MKYISHGGRSLETSAVSSSYKKEEIDMHHFFPIAIILVFASCTGVSAQEKAPLETDGGTVCVSLLLWSDGPATMPDTEILWQRPSENVSMEDGGSFAASAGMFPGIGSGSSPGLESVFLCFVVFFFFFL